MVAGNSPPAGSTIIDLNERLDQFFRTFYLKEIQMLALFPEGNSFTVDFDHLIRFSSALADAVLDAPDMAIEAAEKALKQLLLGQQGVLDTAAVRTGIRFTNLPPRQRVLIRDIRHELIGKLVCISGIVRKATDVRPKLVVGAYDCQRCGEIIRIPQEGDRRKEPFLCQGCEKKGPFTLLAQESVFVDAQKASMQEDLDDLRGGEHPKQLAIILEEDLTGRITPGQRIEAVGILRAAPKQGRDQKPRIFELFLETNSLLVVESDFDEVTVTEEEEAAIHRLAQDPGIYEKMRRSIAPHIYGYGDIKEAIVYQLFSSPTLELPDGAKIRGDSHILVMGEPSTGKSEILQYVARELAPRGIYTSGKGTSAAGLTATAVKDEFGDGGWTLEAGALVLADRGVACVDEFNQMEAEDRSAMHEAMEQGTVSIAKAGILATFRARCSILAAANPKYGRFDAFKPLAQQVDLPPALLSRFDLIFFPKDDIKDTQAVAKHVMDTVVSPVAIAPDIPPELLKKYVAYARRHIMPEINQEARERIESFYVGMRTATKDDKDVPIPLTPRQLWAVLRIARASARVRLSSMTTLEDAERAIRLMKVSLGQAYMDVETGRIDVDSVMSGVTKSQRDRYAGIMDIVKQLEREYGTAKKAEILAVARQKYGTPEREALAAIDKLKMDGSLFEPKFDEYKST